MDADMAHYRDGEVHPTLRRLRPRNFRFIDQTDRSQKAATAYRAIVRSHVMTEIRRQQRFGLEFGKEASSSMTAFACETSGKDSDRIWNATCQASPGRQTASTNDCLLNLVSCSAEPQSSLRTNSGEPSRATVPSYEPRNAQCGSDIRAAKSTSGRLDLLASTVLETHTLQLDLIWARDASSEAMALDAAADQEDAKNVCSVGQTGEASAEWNPATTPSPAILGASRVDPFRVLPVTAGHDVHQLVDHYTVTLPTLMYGTRCRHPIQHQLYNVATQDPAAFHAMLAYSARQFDAISGFQTSERTLAHSSRALKLVSKRIREPSFECEDGLVMAVAVLAFAERRFGEDVIAQRHWLALREILKSRGGMAGLQINRWLAATLYWNCLVWSGTPNRNHAATIEWSSLIDSNDSDMESSAVFEFRSFLSNLTCARSRLLGHVSSGCEYPCLYSCARRRAVFQLNGPIYKVVETQNCSQNADDDSAGLANVQRTASACQLPCLLYLNIVMLEYEARPDILEHYLEKLMVCVYEDCLDMDLSAEHLLIKLLVGLEDSTTNLTSRAHQTIRVAAMIQKMGQTSRQKIHSSLLEALVLPEIHGQSGFSNDSSASRAEPLHGSLGHHFFDEMNGLTPVAGMPHEPYSELFPTESILRSI